jgi:hypothetical protein
LICLNYYYFLPKDHSPEAALFTSTNAASKKMGRSDWPAATTNRVSLKIAGLERLCLTTPYTPDIFIISGIGWIEQQLIREFGTLWCSVVD